MLKSHVCFNIDFSVSDYKIKVCISSSCNAEIFEFNFQARHSRCVCKTMRENLMNRRIVQVIGGCDFIATVSVNLVLKMRTDGVVFNRISTVDNGIAICSSLNRSVWTNRNGSMELLKISFRQPEVVLALAKMVHDVHEKQNVPNPL